MTWKFETSGLDGQCELFGVNIFESGGGVGGEKGGVTDPHNGSKKVFHVDEGGIEGKPRRFAAGEFSNCVWGFYLETHL